MYLYVQQKVIRRGRDYSKCNLIILLISEFWNILVIKTIWHRNQENGSILELPCVLTQRIHLKISHHDLGFAINHLEKYVTGFKHHGKQCKTRIVLVMSVDIMNCQEYFPIYKVLVLDSQQRIIVLQKFMWTMHVTLRTKTLRSRTLKTLICFHSPSETVVPSQANWLHCLESRQQYKPSLGP